MHPCEAKCCPKGIEALKHGVINNDKAPCLAPPPKLRVIGYLTAESVLVRVIRPLALHGCNTAIHRYG